MTSPSITIRPAREADELLIRRLAALDSRPVPKGDVLLAETDGRPVAAVGIADGRTVADPFVATADTTAVLQIRAKQLRIADRAATAAPVSRLHLRHAA
jgi:hypothetical protein